MEEVEDTQHFIELYNLDVDEHPIFAEFFEYQEFFNRSDFRNLYGESFKQILSH